MMFKLLCLIAGEMIIGTSCMNLVFIDMFNVLLFD